MIYEDRFKPEEIEALLRVKSMLKVSDRVLDYIIAYIGYESNFNPYAQHKISKSGVSSGYLCADAVLDLPPAVLRRHLLQLSCDCEEAGRKLPDSHVHRGALGRCGKALRRDADARDPDLRHGRTPYVL